MKIIFAGEQKDEETTTHAIKVQLTSGEEYTIIDYGKNELVIQSYDPMKIRPRAVNRVVVETEKT